MTTEQEITARVDLLQNYWAIIRSEASYLDDRDFASVRLKQNLKLINLLLETPTYGKSS